MFNVYSIIKINDNEKINFITLFPITEVVCKYVGRISAYTETIKKTVSYSGGRITEPGGRITQPGGRILLPGGRIHHILSFS